jgi:DNA ligase-1
MEKTIYKKDSKGKVRYLTVATSHGDLIQESGVLETDNPIIHRKTCKPKNIGRANETTATEQAISEGQSKVSEKLRQGYFNTIEEAEKGGGLDFMAPMLAHKYSTYAKQLKFPCWVQPKLDGIRCFDTPDGKISRTNKPILTMEHIEVKATLVDVVAGSPFGLVLENLIIDGELYAHGKSFQENMRLIKKHRPGESNHVKFHIYDVVSDKPFRDRIMVAKEIVEVSKNCELVPTYQVRDMKDVQNFHKEFLEQGYEGTIIRWGDEGYDVNKRSKYLLKYKDFLDEAYKVIDVVPNDANPLHGTVVCTTDDGRIFKTGMKFSHAEREEMLLNKDKYIGNVAEVRFFEFSEDGIPRFPVCVGFRLDK